MTPPLNTECIFPHCNDPIATTNGTCESHRNVRVSSTGSWIESELHEDDGGN